MAATNDPKINFERLWDLSNSRDLYHVDTSEIAGRIYSIENAGATSSNDPTTPEQRAEELAQNKRSVIAWAQRQFSDLLNDGPERFYDPIRCALYTHPQTHRCGDAEHTLDPSCLTARMVAVEERVLPIVEAIPEYLVVRDTILRHFERYDLLEGPVEPRHEGAIEALREDLRPIRTELEFITGVISSLVTHAEYSFPGRYIRNEQLCPYSRTAVNPLPDRLLQEEIYRFVLTRMGVLPSTQGAGPTSSSDAPTTTTNSDPVPINPIKILQSVGGQISGLINEIDRELTGYQYQTPEHVEQEAEICMDCRRAASTYPFTITYMAHYDRIEQTIASLPEDVQSTLHLKTWERRGSADTSADPNWGKTHLLTNLHRTLSVVRETMRELMAKPRITHSQE